MYTTRGFVLFDCERHAFFLCLHKNTSTLASVFICNKHMVLYTYLASFWGFFVVVFPTTEINSLLHLKAKCKTIIKRST